MDPMNIEQLRKLCLSFPCVTEQIQWEDALLFKVAGKMFAVASLEPGRVWLSFKVTPEDFAELTERRKAGRPLRPAPVRRMMRGVVRIENGDSGWRRSCQKSPWKSG